MSDKDFEEKTADDLWREREEKILAIFPEASADQINKAVKLLEDEWLDGDAYGYRNG